MKKLDRKTSPSIKPIVYLDLPKINRMVMPNKSKFALLGNTVQEDVFRLDILVNGGQWRQEMPLQSAFTNKMLGEGTQRMSSVEISESLDRYGAWLAYNSGVSSNSIHLFSLNKYAKETLDVLNEIVKEPAFPLSEFQVMVENARQKYIVNSRKVDSISRVAFSKMVLGENHPCSKYACSEGYTRLQTSNLRDFYTRYYHSQNTSLYLSGNPDLKVRSLVENLFGEKFWGVDSTTVQMIPVPPVPSNEKELFIEVADAVQNSVHIGCLTIRQNHLDFTKLSVLVTLLGGYFGSRLMSNIREDKGYTYGIGSSLVTYPYESLFVVSTQCDAKYVRPLIQEVYNEIENLRDNLVSQEELDMVKSYMLGELTRRYEGLGLSDAFIFAEVSGFEDDFMQKQVDSIRSTTIYDIQQMAKKYLQTEKMKVVIAGKKV
jgi:predicted Zn-dependent peptidase